MYAENDNTSKIIDMYADTLYRIAFTYLGNRSDAEDIVQETFQRYIKKKPKFDSSEYEKAWFIRVTINLCKDYLKSFWYKNTTELSEDVIAPNEENKEIWECVRQLSPKYRIVIELYYREGYSIKEIALILKKNPSTIGNQLSRAKKLLEKMLKEDDYE